MPESARAGEIYVGLWFRLIPSLWAAFWLGYLVAPAEAQDAAGRVITVRPSGTDQALAAEERIQRRLKRSAEMLRSICIGCGKGDAAAGAAPFDPMAALRGGGPSQTLSRRDLPDQVIEIVRPAPNPAEIGNQASR